MNFWKYKDEIFFSIKKFEIHFYCQKMGVGQSGIEKGFLCDFTS